MPVNQIVLILLGVIVAASLTVWVTFRFAGGGGMVWAGIVFLALALAIRFVRPK